MIRIRELVKSYGSSFKLTVGDLKIKEGKITALLGPNGSGKSTLLKLIAGIERADVGTIGFNGTEIHPKSEVPVSWRRLVTMVMQEPYLFGGTVFDNTAYGLKVRGESPSVYGRKIKDILDRVGLLKYENRKVWQLSGGEAKRTALARSLVLESRILLLDEPTANIDRENVGLIEQLIRSLSGKTGLTVVIATHNLEQAYRLADEVISIIGGNVVPAHPENVFEGTVKESRNGLKIVSLKGGLELEIDTPLSGGVHLAIDPTNIIVSREKLASSARNSISGRLVTISAHRNRVRLTVNAGVDFDVIVTEKSYREMALNPGDTVYLTFKTTTVKAF